MEQVFVEAESRFSNTAGALRQLRESGRIPAVLYGHGISPQPISVPEKWFQGQHRIGKAYVQLNVNGQVVDAFVREIQRDPMSQQVKHVDFYRVDRAQPMDASVPLHLHGTDQVERRGGIVSQQLRELAIRAMPGDTPEYISVDVAHLGVGDTICVSDVVLPPSITLRANGSEVIASIVTARSTVSTADIQIDVTNES